MYFLCYQNLEELTKIIMVIGENLYPLLLIGYSKLREEQKKKEDKLEMMEEKFNTMQSQMQTMLSVLSSIHTQEGKQEIAKQLILKGVYKNI